MATSLHYDGVKRLETLSRANDHLDEKWKVRVRWVSAEKLHLTWLFLGEVDEELVDDVAESLGEAVGSRAWNSSSASNSVPASNNGSVSVAYDHFELWPSPRKARLGVIVPSTVAPEIAEVARAISNSLSKFLSADQQEANKRPFTPHLTAMRLGTHSRKGGVHSGGGKPRASIDDVNVPRSVFPIHQPIDRVELFESDMGKKVAGYLTRACFKI